MHRLLIITALLLLTACERELDMDYRTVEPLYVAEVQLSPGTVKARVTTTRAVKDDGTADYYVDDAVVTIKMTDGVWVDTLSYTGLGNYTLRRYYYVEEGGEYEVDVCIGGRHHRSTSVMHGMPVVNDFHLEWMNMMSEKMLFASLRLQDPADENNYYFMHLYRNDVGYRWAVMNDRSNPGAELQQLFACCTKRDMDDGKSDALHEGDRLRLEIRSIDRRAYDYLYSLQLMDNTGTNPVANFTDGLLGYFSAYQQATIYQVFRLDSIR